MGGIEEGDRAEGVAAGEVEVGMGGEGRNGGGCGVTAHGVGSEGLVQLWRIGRE